MSNAKNKTTSTKKAETKNTTVKNAAKKGATYTFGGEYFCREANGLNSKQYELAVTFPELLNAPLAVFKKGVSEPGHPIFNLMIKKYSDYVSIRTYNVLKVENNTGTKAKKTNDINVMDIDQLKVYAEENDIEIDLEIYNNDVSKVREAIELALSDPEKFKEEYEKAVEEYKFKQQLDELNETDETDETQDENSGETDGDKDVDDLLDDLDGDENDTHE